IEASRIEHGFAALESDARRTLEQERFGAAASVFARFVDLRYVSQQWEMALPVASEGWDVARIRADFEAAHQRQYGHMQPDGAIEIVRQRVTGTGRLRPLPAPVVAAIDAEQR